MSSTTSSFPERIRLSGEGLVLRDWTEADLAAMPELFDHPDIAYWTPLSSPFDETAARNRLDRDRRLRADGTTILLAITVDGGAPSARSCCGAPPRARNSATPSARPTGARAWPRGRCG